MRRNSSILLMSKGIQMVLKMIGLTENMFLWNNIWQILLQPSNVKFNMGVKNFLFYHDESLLKSLPWIIGQKGVVIWKVCIEILAKKVSYDSWLKVLNLATPSNIQQVLQSRGGKSFIITCTIFLLQPERDKINFSF